MSGGGRRAALGTLLATLVYLRQMFRQEEV